MTDFVSKSIYERWSCIVQFMQGKGHTLCSKINTSYYLSLISYFVFVFEITRSKASVCIDKEQIVYFIEFEALLDCQSIRVQFTFKDSAYKFNLFFGKHKEVYACVVSQYTFDNKGKRQL